jgi:CRISPR-associated protein Cas1
MKKSYYIYSSGRLERKENTIYFITSDGRGRYLPVENSKRYLCDERTRCEQ